MFLLCCMQVVQASSTIHHPIRIFFYSADNEASLKVVWSQLDWEIQLNLSLISIICFIMKYILQSCFNVFPARNANTSSFNARCSVFTLLRRPSTVDIPEDERTPNSLLVRWGQVDDASYYNVRYFAIGNRNTSKKRLWLAIFLPFFRHNTQQ